MNESKDRAGQVMLRTVVTCLGMIAVLAGLAGFGDLAWGQVEPGEKDYRFRKGDTVYLSVPMRPSLNGDLVIDEKGAVVLPLIGSVDVAGLTLSEMHARVYQALRDLYPSLRETDVSIEPVLGWVIYLTGALTEPGRYSFSRPPRVWEAIRKAGGPTADAVLDVVRIVSADGDTSQSRTVDVLNALETGTVDQLPVLGKESTVVVPNRREDYVGAYAVNVLGAVAKPGFYRLPSEHHDLMSAILLAGGATDRGSLKKVTILRREQDDSMSARTVNLNRYLETGDVKSNPLLQGGDTVNVPGQSSISYQLKNNSLGLLVGLIAATASVLLVVEYYQD